MNNSSIIILDNKDSNYKQVIKYLESLDDNSEQTIEKSKQNELKNKRCSNRLSIDISQELAIKLHEVADKEYTTKSALVRKILDEYCNYYLENESNIKLNNYLVWSNSREQ